MTMDYDGFVYRIYLPERQGRKVSVNSVQLKMVLKTCLFTSSMSTESHPRGRGDGTSVDVLIINSALLGQ